MTTTPGAGAFRDEVDLLVLGTGAAGLMAAVTAAAEGLDVLVLEISESLGGTTAYSAGTCWMPGNEYLVASGDRTDTARARTYLDELVGRRAPRALRETYLERGPEMVKYLGGLGVHFWHSPTVVDYHPEIEGFGIGRALEPEPFDGRLLSRRDFARVRWPIPEFALFGGTMMVRRAEVNRLLDLFRFSPGAAALALRLGMRWAFDRLRFPRGTRLTMGNALVAHLLHAFRQRGGEVIFNSTAKSLELDGGRVVGAVVTHSGAERRIRVRRGVVLAGGGFSANRSMRDQHLPSPAAQFTPAVAEAAGTTIALAVDAGAVLGDDHGDNAFWFPSSIGRRRDGSRVVFPHIWDRAKPGLIAVTSAGSRFVDESVSYHRFTRAMYRVNSAESAIPAWLIVDSRTLRRYGLGMIRPHTPSRIVDRYVSDGYIHRDRSLAGLARQIGVDPDGLTKAVSQNNADAATGVDWEFAKGTSPFGRQYGDPAHKPNVNLGTISREPFYALAVVPTPLGTALGIRTDERGRALDRDGVAISGLYAAGNDADSVMAAEYPGAGCQIGAALTFGYLAALDASASEDA